MGSEGWQGFSTLPNAKSKRVRVDDSRHRQQEYPLDENQSSHKSNIENNTKGFLSKTRSALFEGENSKRNMAIATGLVLAAIAAAYTYKQSGSTAAKEEQAAYEEEVKRVRFADEDNRMDEETLMRQRAVEERDADLHNVRMLMQSIQINESALKNNAAEMNKVNSNANSLMNNETKASYDDDMSSFESEQNLSTAFMMKDDIDKKRNGVNQLNRELGLQKQHFTAQRMQQNNELNKAVHMYAQKYPGDRHPMVVEAANWVRPPTPNSQAPPRQQQQPMMQ